MVHCKVCQKEQDKKKNVFDSGMQYHSAKLDNNKIIYVMYELPVWTVLNDPGHGESTVRQRCTKMVTAYRDFLICTVDRIPGPGFSS